MCTDWVHLRVKIVECLLERLALGRCFSTSEGSPVEETGSERLSLNKGLAAVRIHEQTGLSMYSGAQWKMS